MTLKGTMSVGVVVQKLNRACDVSAKQESSVSYFCYFSGWVNPALGSC